MPMNYKVDLITHLNLVHLHNLLIRDLNRPFMIQNPNLRYFINLEVDSKISE